MNTLLILFSLFLIVVVGLVARKFNLLPEESSKYFNKFIFYVSVPAVVFLSVAGLNQNQLAGFLPFIYSNITIIFTGYILVFLIVRILNISKEKKGVLIYTGNGGNVVYFGFPLMLSLFGKDHFAYGVMYGTVVITVGDLLGFYLLGINKGKGSLNIKEATADFLKNPIVIATILGTFFALLKITLPQFISNTLETLSKATTGLALFSLGIYLYGKMNFDDLNLNLLSSFFKLMFLPILAYMFATFVFGLEGSAYETSIMMAAMPTAVFSLIVADAYDLDKKLTSNTIVLSSLLFLLTSGFWVWFLQIVR